MRQTGPQGPNLIWIVADTLRADRLSCYGYFRRTSPTIDELSQDLYDCSILYLDAQIKRMLETLDQLHIIDNTVIVLTADHGEGLGNHGIWGHGLPYEDTTHIPLVIWQPQLLPIGVRVQGFAQHIDVAPTILDLLGISSRQETLAVNLGSFGWITSLEPTPVRMEGQSLLPYARGERIQRDFAVTEVRRAVSDPGYRALTTAQWKYIESLSGDRRLYHRQRDPMEKIDLAESELERTETMAQTLQEWIRRHIGESDDPMRVCFGE